MRLLLVELSRFRSRRAVALLLLAAAVLTAVVAATTVWETRPVSAQDRAEATALAQAEAESSYVQEELDACQEDPESYLGPEGSAGDCEAVILPPEWFLERTELSLAEEKDDSGLGVLVITSALMIIAGTTFAGADWASGSMSNQLLFVPRRGRVWLSKAAAVFVAALLATTLIVAAFWLTLFLVADSRDLTVAAAVSEDIRWSAGRGILLAAAGATGAYALTMLLRHTVGTLALMFAYLVGGEMLLAVLPVEGAGRWSLGNNVFAWIQDGYEYYDESVACDPTAMDMCDQMVTLSLADAAPYLGVVLVVVVILSLVMFRRRDIP